MSNCVVTIEIDNYHPDTLNFDNISFIFRSDAKDFEEEITYLNKNSIVHKTTTKRDIKYTVKVSKAGSLIGITEFVISHNLLNKKEESFSKNCSVTMTDSMKRLILGNPLTADSIKIMIRATIQYGEKQGGGKQSNSLSKKETIAQSQQGQSIKPIDAQKDRDTKTPPINQIKMAAKSASNIKKPNSGNNKNQSSAKKASNSTNENYNQNERKALPENDPLDTSVIAPLLCNELPQIDRTFQDLITKYSEEIAILERCDITDIDQTLAKTKELIGKLFKIQQEYYFRMNKTLEINNQLKTILYTCNEKYRTVIKKMNKLKQQNELQTFTNDVINPLKDEENQHKSVLIPIKKQEMLLYKHVFNKTQAQEDKQTEAVKHSREEVLLAFALRNIIQTYGNLSKVTPNNKTSNLNYLVEKYSLPQPERAADLTKSTQGNAARYDDKIILEQSEKNTTPNKLEPEDIPMTHVIAESIDQTDIKLNEYLTYFYSKRKIIQIPFRKTTNNNYEYGSQKVMVKAEGETFRIRFVGGYLLLDKFIEANAPIEDAKMHKKAIQNINNNSSSNYNTNKNAQSKSKGKNLYGSKGKF